MMNAKEIHQLLDPKNQNLPKLSAESSSKKYDNVYVPVFDETVKDIEKEFPGAKALKMKGEKGEKFDLVNGKQVVHLRGMGSQKKLNPRKIREMVGALYLAGESAKLKKFAIHIGGLDDMYYAAMAVHISALDPKIYKGPDKKNKAPEVGLVHKSFKAKAAKAKSELKRGTNTAEARNLMRILGACPPNRLTTTTYAKVIEMVAKDLKVKCKNVPKKDLKKYELLNAVSLGSEHDSKLLIITIPVKGSKKATAVVGKGICYDSGGMQGKGSYMNSMKEDMAGSASVLGTVYNIVKNKMKLKQTTHFMMPLAENMMGQSANRADDIWKAGDGQLVEIKHTDAEGRLVMGDAICYAKKHYKDVDTYYTIATLTGSCVVALGEIYTGNLCNDDKLRAEAVKAGEEFGDLVHPGPWDLDYDDNNSAIADVANLGEKDRDAGWLKAGYYLARFVPRDKKTGDLKAKFCHFDIAGSIDMHARGSGKRKKGFSSGVGVGYLSLLLTK